MNSYQKNIYWITAALIGIVISFYYADKPSEIKIPYFNNESWKNGVHKTDGAAIVIDKSPFSLGISLGGLLKFDNGEQREVSKIIGKYGPYWEVWLKGAGFDKIKQPSSFHVYEASSIIWVFIFSFLGNCAIFFISTISIFFILKSKISNLSNLSLYGISYFTGISVFLLLWRVSSAIFNSAQSGLIATIFTLLISYIVIKLKTQLNIREFFEQALIHLCLAFILTIYFILYWVIPMREAMDFSHPNLPFGPFESGRYANISSFIHTMDIIPVLKQSYGQSILSSISSFAGEAIPRLSLIFWLAISTGGLILLVVGYLKNIKMSNNAIISVLFIVIFGNPRLTGLFVQLTENNSTPLIYNAYADTVLSLGALLSSFIVITDKMISEKYLIPCLIIFFATAIWSLCGFQMIPTFLLMCLSLALYGIKSREFNPKLPIFAGFVVAIGVVLELPLGGMLTPDRYISQSDIPGIWPGPNAKLEDFQFFLRSLNVLFLDPLTWGHQLSGHGVNIKDLSWSKLSEINKSISIIEVIIFDLLRSVFFVVVGIGYLLFRRVNEHKPLLIVTFCALSVGVLFANIVSLENLHINFLRFMNIAYFLGMILFGISIYYLFQSRRRLVQYTAIILVILSCAGSMTGALFQIIGSYRNLSFAEKINIMVSVPSFTTAEK